MLPRHMLLVISALRPALARAHLALTQPLVGAGGRYLPSDAEASFQALREADDAVAAALNACTPLLSDAVAVNDTVTAQYTNATNNALDRLLSVYWVCLNFAQQNERQLLALADLSRDTLVTYTHFLSDLLQALVNLEQGRTGDSLERDAWGKYHITLSCRTELPDSFTELPDWQSRMSPYDERYVALVLSLTADFADPPRDRKRGRCFEIADEPSSPADKSTSLGFWHFLGWGIVLSMFFGGDDCHHDHDA